MRAGERVWGGAGGCVSCAGDDLRLDHDFRVANLLRCRDRLRGRAATPQARRIHAQHTRSRTSFAEWAAMPTGTLMPFAFISAELWYCVAGGDRAQPVREGD